MTQRGLRPRRGDRIDIDIGFAAREQAVRAELGEARVDRIADRAELRIARITEAQHRVFQLRQSRRATRGDEFDEAARIVRRIAFALRADDDVQQALGCELAQRIRIRAQQPRGNACAFGFAREMLGDALRVAGLAAVDDRQRGRRDGRRDRRRSRRRGIRAPLRTDRSDVTGDPVENVRIEPVDETRQLRGLLGR